MSDSESFYAEWVHYDQNEKEESILYLRLWKHFLLKKLPHLKLIDESYIYRDNWEGTSLQTIALKLFFIEVEEENKE